MTGKYKHSVDGKGRLFLPAKMRDELGRNVCVSRSLTHECAVVYSQRQWEDIKAKIRELPIDEASEIQTELGAYSSEQELDSQGRIIIKQELRDDFDLGGEVMVVGALEWVQIWNLEKWQEKEASFSLEKMKKSVGKLIFNGKTT